MMRLGVIERTADHLRELLANAERVDVDHVQNAEAWCVGDVTLVVDPKDKVLATVLKEADR